MRLKNAILAVACAAASLFGLAAEAQQKPPIKLGNISSLTGPLGVYGKTQEIVVRLAVEDINKKGGVNGSQLLVESVDAQLDPGQAVLLFRKFANEGYFAVVGPITGTQWETVSPLANRIGLPAIAPNASKPGITIRPWTIRLVPADDTLIPEGFEAFRKLYSGIKRVAIVADVREASGKAGADVFMKLAKGAGMQVVDVVEFSTRATDLSPAAIQVKGQNPDAVFVVALAHSALMLAKAFKEQNMNAPVLANSIIWPGPFVNTIGDEGKNWHTIGFSTNEQTTGDAALYASVVKRFVERADASLGKPANMANWSVTYDAFLLLADIMRRHGIDGNTDPKKAREVIKDEFVKLKTFVGLNNTRLRDTGDGYVPAVVLTPDFERRMWKLAGKQTLQSAGAK